MEENRKLPARNGWSLEDEKSDNNGSGGPINNKCFYGVLGVYTFIYV